ncbi:hypothetical protein GN956_G10714 [Arapaima gigas]
MSPEDPHWPSVSPRTSASGSVNPEATASRENHAEVTALLLTGCEAGLLPAIDTPKPSSFSGTKLHISPNISLK